MRIVVVGGGILGLATARLLAREQPGAEVTLLEKEPQLALHQTARNSGVVHAGLYYEPGSLKARLCRRGVELLRAFCAERGVPYEACGKLVVALEEAELPRLERLEQRARANGVPGLRRLDAAQLREVEPHAAGIAALHSPRTAITDFRAVALALAAELTERGGVVRTAAEVVRVRPGAGAAGAAVELADGTELRADRTIVCAGLHADRLARRSGEDAAPRIVPFRGEYWALRPERRELVRGLIYPVPDPALPFLGVHLTRTIDGSVLIGPNAVMALAREGYARSTVHGRELVETLAWGGTWRLMRRHWRAGAGELRRALSNAAFVGEARRYVPELRTHDAVRASSGVRAQAVDRDGALVDDFRIGGDARIAWIRNAPSPGATSSLAIAEEIVGRLAFAA
ncbi:MAG TPA: L-2-hydroxyglutarate oxidase [Conexibacter sp.]|jgi:L-2-hydroxyglutarate oxidase|nr:L-2-hydroxyglutarate oxidase [Conexibacter sp.]